MGKPIGYHPARLQRACFTLKKIRNGAVHTLFDSFATAPFFVALLPAGFFVRSGSARERFDGRKPPALHVPQALPHSAFRIFIELGRGRGGTRSSGSGCPGSS